MKPFFPYPGGKSKLFKAILPFVPACETYVEPFCGGLSVLLAHAPFPREVANDKNSSLIDIYRVASRHPEAFVAELHGRVASREDFKNEVAFPITRTQLGRAARQYWILKQSFGAQGEHFGRGAAHHNGYVESADSLKIHAFAERCAKTEFTASDAVECILKNDSEKTFFFCDPPYISCAKTAYDPFSEQDMARVRDCLAQCRGKWLLTCDDSPETRRVFDGFPMRGNTIRYSISLKKTGKESSEMMIFSPNLAADFPGETIPVSTKNDFCASAS